MVILSPTPDERTEPETHVGQSPTQDVTQCPPFPAGFGLCLYLFSFLLFFHSISSFLPLNLPVLLSKHIGGGEDPV